jgi:hypothetical protein
VAIDQGDTGRVVTSVLHPAQRIHHNGPGIARPDVANDSTHNAYGTAGASRHQQIDIYLRDENLDVQT